MPLVKMDAQKSAGGGGTLVADGFTDSGTYTQYTFASDHDAVLLVSHSTGTNDYVPTYNGVTYQWFVDNTGSAIIICDVKAGTTMTFNRSTSVAIKGYKYQ